MNPSGGGAGGHEPIASATTGTVKNISQTGATLSGSYSLTEGKVSELGIQYGTGTLESTVKTFTGETKRFNLGTKIPATLEAPATKTGFDLYAGLPDDLESLIESESPS